MSKNKTRREHTCFQLQEMITETVRKVLVEYGIDTTGTFNFNRDYSELKIIRIEDSQNFMKWAKPVWDMLTISYENHGGLKSYRDFSDFVRKEHILLLVLNNPSSLLACATYRSVSNSSKMVAIGCDQTREGKNALEFIIQDNIKNFDLHYWAEVSGAIEHYFKKHNGFPMPNTLASEILEVSESKISLSKEDNVHYSRRIGQEQGLYEKMIFGIKSDEIFQKAMNEVEDYGSFMNEVNNIIDESVSKKYTIRQAIYIIENIYRAHEEDGFNELIPSWHQGLVDSLYALENSTEKSKMVVTYIKYAKYLLSDMQLLELHPLKLRMAQ